MNFQYIAPIEKSNVLLDNAFRQARKKSSFKLTGQWIDKVRKKEMIKIDVSKSKLNGQLQKINDDFPSFDGLPDFYKELAKLTLDVKKVKRALSAIQWTCKQISSFQKEYASSISKSDSKQEIQKSIKEYYGRVSSVLKNLEKHLLILENARKVLKTYPDLKDMFTICIFGFPNVGKTTLLNKLAKSKAKIAPYSFTTKGINVGYFAVKGKKIQLLDVPGTLARLNKQNLIEKQAYAALKVADAVIYIFDLTEPYPLQKQEELFQTIEKKKKVLIYASKTDFLDRKIVENFKKKYAFNSLSQLINKLQSFV